MRPGVSTQCVYKDTLYVCSAVASMLGRNKEDVDPNLFTAGSSLAGLKPICFPRHFLEARTSNLKLLYFRHIMGRQETETHAGRRQ